MVMMELDHDELERVFAELEAPTTTAPEPEEVSITGLVTLSATELIDVSDNDGSSAASTSPACGLGGSHRRDRGVGGGTRPAGRSRRNSGDKPLWAQLPASCDPPFPGTPTKPLVWIVFGGTGHMGRSVVKSVLAHGDSVTTVGREIETTPAAIERLATAAGPNCLGALCDLRVYNSVERVVRRTLDRFGRLDVIANCSGFGVMGSCEDQDNHELRTQFETNFMGTVHILQTTLPILRTQRDGRYLIFSSTAGALGVPGLGPYCATKYAVEGLVEAMLYEVDPFNIKATLVEPGLVRRDDNTGGGGNFGEEDDGTIWNEPGKQRPATHWGHFLIKTPSAPYAQPTAPAGHMLRMIRWLGARQPTSVVQCAELVWQLAHCSFPPLRLPLGSYAIESIRDRLRCVTEELEDWKHLNFPRPQDAGESEEKSRSAHPAMVVTF